MLKLLARQEDIDLTVFFTSDLSVGSYYDAGFASRISWDVPLLDGYEHVFLGSAGRSWSRDLRQQLTPGRFDALWMHGYAQLGSLAAIRHARSAGMKVLLRGESNLLRRQWSRPGKRIRRQLLARLFRKVDGFLSIGACNREFYEHHDARSDRIFSMPYAVDNAFFQRLAQAARPEREAFRCGLALEPGRPVILYCSKLMARKRPDDLLEAYISLSPDGVQEPRPYLLFVGDGAEASALSHRARQTGWNSIRFLGFRNQTQLPSFYDLCDVLVLPSAYEPWGLVINEVMNAGKPVVVSEGVGCAPDLVEDGKNGYVVPVGAREELARCLARIVSEPEIARSMGRHSLQRIGSWGFDENISGLLAALDQVVDP